MGEYKKSTTKKISDFDDDYSDELIEDEDDTSYWEEAISAGKVRKIKTKKKKLNTNLAKKRGPELWDDDWTDPADDIMFGLDK